MPPIIIGMLILQVAIVLVTAGTIVMAKPKQGRHSGLFSTAVSLFVISTVSFQIAERHEASAGARLLEYGSGVLIGMCILSFLVLLRQRRGTDAMP